ncbi:MAG: hypothetical protein ACTHOJ_17975, partial [Sphingomonas oligoaromativorans]
MFTCYIDDSDAPVGNNVGLAGYYAKDDDWQRFEERAGIVFNKFNVSVLHSTKLQDGKGDFKGWDGHRKSDFIAHLLDAASDLIVEGVAAYVVKDHFRSIRDRDGMQNFSPLSLCFATLVSAICLKSPCVDQVNTEGLSFLVESG